MDTLDLLAPLLEVVVGDFLVGGAALVSTFAFPLAGAAGVSGSGEAGVVFSLFLFLGIFGRGVCFGWERWDLSLSVTSLFLASR